MGGGGGIKTNIQNLKKRWILRVSIWIFDGDPNTIFQNNIISDSGVYIKF